MKHIFPSLRILAFFTILTGVLYPLAITGIAGALFSEQAGGSLIWNGDKVIGSALISQKFESSKYFWGRPSAVDYNPLPSGGSNAGPTNADFKKAVEERAAKLKAAHQADPPQDLIFASSSGLDPHISPEAARYQIDRVATARNFNSEQKTKLQALVDSQIERRQFGIFGEKRVNVLELNLAVDKL